MNETLNTDTIKHLLNRSLMQMDSATLLELNKARERALAVHAEVINTALVSPTSGQVASHDHAAHYRLRQWGVVLLLIASLFSCVAYWQHSSEPSDDEVDIAILIDDLPVEMYAE